MLEVFFYLPGPMPVVGQVPIEAETTERVSHACRLGLMAEQVHALHGAPRLPISLLPVDPNWKPPVIIID